MQNAEESWPGISHQSIRALTHLDAAVAQSLAQATSHQNKGRVSGFLQSLVLERGERLVSKLESLPRRNLDAGRWRVSI